MRTMYDAVTPENIPVTAQMVAGYVNGNYQSYWKLAKLFPTAVRVSIAVSADADAQVLDCETYDATPEQCPAWAVRQRARGQIPTVYMNASTWPAVRAAFAAQHVPEPEYWVAKYDGIAEVPAGAVAKQFQGGMTSAYDLSAVADYWPGVDEGDNDMTPEQANQLKVCAEAATDILARLKKLDVLFFDVEGDTNNPSERSVLTRILNELQTLSAGKGVQ